MLKSMVLWYYCHPERSEGSFYQRIGSLKDPSPRFAWIRDDSIKTFVLSSRLKGPYYNIMLKSMVLWYYCLPSPFGVPPQDKLREGSFYQRIGSLKDPSPHFAWIRDDNIKNISLHTPLRGDSG